MKLFGYSAHLLLGDDDGHGTIEVTQPFKISGHSGNPGGWEITLDTERILDAIDEARLKGHLQ